MIEQRIRRLKFSEEKKKKFTLSILAIMRSFVSEVLFTATIL